MLTEKELASFVRSGNKLYFVKKTGPTRTAPLISSRRTSKIRNAADDRTVEVLRQKYETFTDIPQSEIETVWNEMYYDELKRFCEAKYNLEFEVFNL